MTPWYCDEHGKVLSADLSSTGGIEVSAHYFCPVCGRELSRRDALSEMEGPRASSFEEWKEAQDVPVLEFPPIRVDRDAA